MEEEIGVVSRLNEKVMEQKLKYFGHVVRAGGLESQVMLGMGGGARSRGRPRRRWIDEILEVTGMRLREVSSAAMDREGWRRLVNVVTRGRPRPVGRR